MVLTAILCRRRQGLALVVCASLLLNTAAPAIAAAQAEVVSPRLEAWRSVIAGFPADAGIPFLQPYGLSAPNQIEAFLRVAARSDLQPRPDLTPQQVHAAVAAYAGTLAQRAQSLSAVATPGELAALNAELREATIISAIAPEAASALETSQRFLNQAVVDRQAPLKRSIEQAGEAWNDKKDGLKTPAGLAPDERAPRPASWRLQKRTSAAPGPRAAVAVPWSPTQPMPIARPTAFAALIDFVKDKAAALFSPPAAAPKMLSTIRQDGAAATASFEPDLKAETRQALQALGLDSYAQFQRLTQAQVDFERKMLAEHPALKQAIFSLRTQERFSQTVLAATLRLRQHGYAHPLAGALLLAAQAHYDDILPPRTAGFKFNPFTRGGPSEWFRLMTPLAEFIPDKAWKDLGSRALDEAALGIPIEEDIVARRVARALLTPFPTLFVEPENSDAKLSAVLGLQARALGAQLSVLYAHPFTDDRGLIGHKVPMQGDNRLVFGLGELVRQARAAQKELDEARRQGRAPRRFFLLIKNIEALEPGVRTVLQEALRVGELTHPELGAVRLPENLQLLMTMREGTNLEDDSFYDRVVVKTLPGRKNYGYDPRFQPPEELTWPSGVDESNYLKQVTVISRSGRCVLMLPGAKIVLSEEFRGLTPKNLHDEIYLKTGLVLDYETVRQLSAMAQAQERRQPILRVEGPTGLGKTFTASGYARLRGQPFFANPVNSDTNLSEWIGGFEQDENGLFGFNGETTVKRRLEEGGVVAFSELNTLLDHHEKASLGWWLVQIAEAAPDAHGYRTIRLSEVPVPEGAAVAVIRIHPESLIIIDTNPEGEYAARGALPDILKDNTPRLRLGSLVSPEAYRKEDERRLSFFADAFLRHDWLSRGRTLGPAVADAVRRARLAERLAAVYRAAAVSLAVPGSSSRRILSTRELKRMSQDVLAALAAGRSEEEALAQAAYAHLAAFLDDPKSIASMRETLSGLPVEPAQPAAFVVDQLLVKGRPVHLRLGPEAEARREVAAIAERDPAVKLEFVSATEETDRFQMEGGLVPSESGEKLEFGAGIFVRMIEKARAEPDRKIVYVFENAHNLRPEQVVALNEFLQEGRLYPKGAGGVAYELPPNAYVLFVSRSDSALTWSPAERSRFVEYASAPEDWARKTLTAELLDGLRGLPEALAAHLRGWAADAYSRWSAAQAGAAAGLASSARLRWFLDEMRAAAARTVETGLGIDDLAERLKQAFGGVFLASAPQAVREHQADAYFRVLDLLKRTYGHVIFGRSAPPAAGLSALEQERVNYRLAATDEERVKAITALREAAAAAPREAWKERPAVQLKELDVAKALLPAEVLRAMGEILSTAITPDGRTIVTGGRDNKTRVFRWDEQKKEHIPVGEFSQNRWVMAVAITADGRTIVTGSADNKARVFRWDDKKTEYVPSGEFTHEAPVTAVAITPDGRTIITSTRNGDKKVRRFRWDDQREAYIPVGELTHGAWVSALAITPDGGTIVVGSDDKKAHVFRWDDHKKEHVPVGELAHGGAAWAAAISADGRTIVTGSSDQKCRVWRWDDRRNEYVPAGELTHGQWVMAVAITPDGRTIVTGSGEIDREDKKARVFRWDDQRQEYAPAGEFTPGDKVRAVAITADGQNFVVGAGNTTHIYSLEPFIVKDASHLALLKNGREFRREQIGGPVEVLEGPQRPWPQALQTAQIDYSVSATDAERVKAVAALREAAAAAPREAWKERPAVQLKELDVAKALLPAEILTAAGAILSTAITPDGRTIVTGSSDKNIRIFRLDEHRKEHVMVGKFTHDGVVETLAISADGRTIVAGSSTYKTSVSVLRWDDKKNGYVQAGKFMHGRGVAVAISADGRTIVTSGSDMKVRVLRWNDEKQNYIPAAEFRHAKSIRAVAVTADGRTIVTGGEDGKVRVFRLNDEKTEYVPAGEFKHEGWVKAVAITPDGRTIVACNGGDKARVFHLDDEQKAYVPAGELNHGGWITAVAITPDGRTIVTGSTNRGVRVFRLNDQKTEYVPAGEFMPDGSSGAVAITADGQNIIVGNHVYSLEPFILKDASTVTLLKNGDELGRDQIVGPVEVLEGPQRPWPQALQTAQIDYSLSATDAERAKAIAALREAAAAAPKDVWKERPAAQLKELDVAKALLPAKILTAAGNILSAAITPDGRAVVTGSDDKKVRIFRWDDQKKEHFLAGVFLHNDWVRAVAITPDGRTIVTGSNDHKAYVIHWDDKKTEYVSAGEFAHGDWVMAVAIAADGGAIVTVSADGTTRIFRWDNEKKAYVRAGKLAPAGMDVAVAITADGRTIVTGGDDKKARVFRLNDEKTEYVLAGEFTHGNSVTAVAITPDSRTIVTGSHDHRVRLFRLDDQGKEYVPAGEFPHGDQVVAVAITADGQTIVMGISSGKTRVLRRDGQKKEYVLAKELTHSVMVKAVAITADGQHIVVGAGMATHVYSMEPFILKDASTLALLKNGRELSRDQISGEIEVLEGPQRPWPQALQTAQIDYSLSATDAERAKAVTALREASSAAPKEAWKEGPAAQLKELDVAKALLPAEVLSAMTTIRSTAITPDGRTIVMGGNDKKIRIFRWDDQKKEHVPAGEFKHGDWSMTVAISADGRTVVTGSFDKKVRVLRWDDQKKKHFLAGVFMHGNWVKAVALSADGRTVVSSDDHMARVLRWDDQKTEYVPAGEFAHGHEVNAVAITPDGRTIVTGSSDKKARVFRLNDEKTEYVPAGEFAPGHAVNAVAITPDGRTIVTSSIDKKVSILRWNDQKTKYVPAAEFRHADILRAVAVTADGRTIVTGSEDNKARIFRWDDQKTEYLPTGEFMPDGSSGAVAITADGQNIVVGAHVYSLQPFIIKDTSHLALLKNGRELNLSRDQIVGPVTILENAAPGAVPRPAPAFSPRYGDKPFFFAADARGRVYLNFKGRWLPTRHALLHPGAATGGELVPTGSGSAFTVLKLADLKHPHADRPLSESDFLMETPTLEEIERGTLSALRSGRAINLIGSPGAGKTSIAREAALFLGLPLFVFQMHGERELSDLIGGYREDAQGRLRLSSRPTKDAEGRLRFKQPLLDMIANGGVFVLDEGAIGERGRELLSWFAGLTSGAGEIVLQEFPGRELRIPIHPDFGLIITNNVPEETAGRQQPKSEVTSGVHVLRVPDDDDPATLEKIFAHFLGWGAVDAARWGQVVAELHHRLKPLVGKEIGKDNRERYYLSKREVRRVAAQMRRAARLRPDDTDYALYGALRSVYEAMFSHPEERALVRREIEAALKTPTAAFEERLAAESRALFPGAATADEGRVEALTRELFLQGEPVLYLTERGSRAATFARAAAESLSARLEPVDAAPEHGELEILGGLLPRFGSRPAGEARSMMVRGKLTQYLVTKEELEALSRASTSPKPIVLWLRNVDQWREEIRTAINGLLEDGFIDIEDENGRVSRLYRPPYLHLLAEMPTDSTQEFSSAFFNRWVKIGVSSEDAELDLEAVLRSSYDLDALEAHDVGHLYGALTKLDAQRLWSNRGRYDFGPTLFFALAEAMRLAKREDARWRNLLERIGAAGYDPRVQSERGPPSGQRALFDDYRALVAETFTREARRLIGARLREQEGRADIPDSQRFEEVLGVILDGKVPAASPDTLSLDDKGFLAAVSGIPVRRRLGALSVAEASRRTGVRITPNILTALAVLARADSLGRATALVGETGAAKTSVAALWAALTGRSFYKYQSHAGSEAADLTLDIEQDEAGNFRKRVKEFYARLREGRVVVDIDEANVAPWVLWTLEPLLRGERWVHPIFPGEEAFLVGEDVQVTMTFNPTRYSARSAIAPRLLEKTIVAWMDLALPQDMARVVESFYGVWEEGGAQVLQSLPASETAPIGKAHAAVPQVAGGSVNGHSGIDREMRLGQETFDENAPLPAPADGHPAAPARGVFTPELFPYTRHEAFDRYDAPSEQWTRAGALTAIAVPRLAPGQAAALAQELAETHDLFEGRAQMKLGPSWQVLLSAGPEMEFVEFAAYGPDGRRLEAALEIAKDSADNYYVRTPAALNAELRYHVAVPARYFGQSLAAGLPFAYPSVIPDEVKQAMGLIGLNGKESDFREVVHKMAAYFRDFSLEANGIKAHGGSLYLDLVRSKSGVCRHRAFAFARTALGLGLAVRYVVSDIHAWAEVEVPNSGWLRVDLGGGGDPANMDLSPLASERHQPRADDGMPEPENYRRNNERFASRMKKAAEQQGVSPQHASRGGGAGGAGPGGGGSGLAADSKRIAQELKALDQQLAKDAAVNDELAPLFASGRGDTQFVFDRMLRALQDRVRITKLKVKRGLEIDPLAFMLRKPKPFVKRKREEKLQTMAAAVMLDFSGSMASVKNQLAYTIGAVGENFWKLREAAPEHFFYDLSEFADQPRTAVAMGARTDEKENARRLVEMANRAGRGGTDIHAALKAKLQDFVGSRQARGAKVKYVVLYTDGADSGTVELAAGRHVLTEQAKKLMGEYASAGIDVIAIGYGPAAEQVAAFNGPGQHYVRIDTTRSADISEAIAKIAELKSRGAGRLPDGELNALLQIPPPVK